MALAPLPAHAQIRAHTHTHNTHTNPPLMETPNANGKVSKAAFITLLARRSREKGEHEHMEGGNVFSLAVWRVPRDSASGYTFLGQGISAPCSSVGIRAGAGSRTGAHSETTLSSSPSQVTTMHVIIFQEP